MQGKLSVYSHKEQLSSRYLEVMRKKGSLEPRPSVPNFVSQLWKKIRVSLSTIHNANLSHLCVTHNLGVNGTDTVFFSPLTLFVWLHAELNASPLMLQPSLSLSLPVVGSSGFSFVTPSTAPIGWVSLLSSPFRAYQILAHKPTTGRTWSYTNSICKQL